MRLYKLANEITEALASVDETGEISPEALEAIMHLEASFTVKAESLCMVIREYQAAATAAETEALRLSKLAAARLNVAERLKDYLLNQMNLLSMLSLQTPLFAVRVQRNGQAAVLTANGLDLAELPPELVRTETVTTRKLDRKAVLAIAKAGGELPPGVSVEHGSHLRIT